MTTDFDLEHLRSWIGTKEIAREQLTRSLVARFNATFDRKSSLNDGDAAPALIHFCLAQPAVPTARLGQDGHPERGGFLPPVPLPRRMWAGSSIEFHAPLPIGSMIERRSVIEDVTLKTGKSGILCFVKVEHKILSDGAIALVEKQDIVHRAMPDVQEPKKPSAPHSDNGQIASHSREMNVSTPLLFRYSALTFNAHRIHYDKPYAMGEEGYPDLIVHGPLQATMLCLYATDLRKEPMKAFRFRSTAPLYGPCDVSLNADTVADEMGLWTMGQNGQTGMQATARW